MSSEHSLPGPVRVRFAPSPTGTLHVGSARTALYNYLFARHSGGQLVLRIEDTDVARSTRDFEESIIADLRWLGLDWDEGPDTGGEWGPYRQSERVEDGLYRAAALRLVDEGKAYYCFCSQERLEELKQETLARGDMPKYDRRCACLSRDEALARLAEGEPATIRFRVPEGDITVKDIIHGPTHFASDVIGDFIILRSDGGVSYNFAVVVDDAAMEITHVIRGEDHLTNTARQVLVFEALGHEPPQYAHHSLILGPDGGKLSKRHGATSVGDFRRMGYLPSAIINYLALLSWSPGEDEEKLSRDEMVGQFELHRVSKSPAIFDIQKLNWLNGLHIRDLSAEELHAALEPFLGEGAAEGAQVSDVVAGFSEGQLAVAEAAVQKALVTLADAPGQIAGFFEMSDIAGAPELAEELAEEGSGAVIDTVLAGIGELPEAEKSAARDIPADLEKMRALVGGWKKSLKAEGIAPKRLFRTLRIALTGRGSGPELPFLLAGLGRDVVRERLENAKQFTT